MLQRLDSPFAIEMFSGLHLCVAQADQKVDLIHPSHEGPFLVKPIQAPVNLLGGSDPLERGFASQSPNLEERPFRLQSVLPLVVTKPAVERLALSIVREPCQCALLEQVCSVVLLSFGVAHSLHVHHLRYLLKLRELLLDLSDSELLSQPGHILLF